MPTMYDADAQELILKAAEELKKIPEIKAPSWAQFVKTGMHKERPPVNDDWWYMRFALSPNITSRITTRTSAAITLTAAATPCRRQVW